jgi:hypothetical protein
MLLWAIVSISTTGLWMLPLRQQNGGAALAAVLHDCCM